jgi:hypothetical protein
MGVGGLNNREARNEAYRQKVDAQLDRQAYFRQAGGGFLSNIFDYITTVDPQAAQGESFLRDLGQALSPKTFELAQKIKPPATPEVQTTTEAAEAAVTEAGAVTEVNSRITTEPATPATTPETKTTEENQPTLGENFTKALKQVLPQLSAEGVKALTKKQYKFNPTNYAMSSPRRVARGRRKVGFSPIAGSGFKDGGDLLGRELFLGGGEIEGPGGPKEDLVPIWASDKEYVVSADAVTRLGNGDHEKGIATLDRINFG